MRTDRDHPLFSSQDAPALGVMHRVLLSYVMYNQDLGYSQVRLLLPRWGSGILGWLGFSVWLFCGTSNGCTAKSTCGTIHTYFLFGCKKNYLWHDTSMPSPAAAHVDAYKHAAKAV